MSVRVTTKEKSKTLGADSQGQNIDPGSRLPGSKSLLWEPAPRVKIFILGADSQGRNLYSGSRIPGSKSLPWEPAPRVKIFTLGAGSQVQNLDPGSRLPGTWESVLYTCLQHTYCNVKRFVKHFRLSLRSFCSLLNIWLNEVLRVSISSLCAFRAFRVFSAQESF